MANSQSKISSAIETSREELLDLGLRNPLLNYRSSRARGVEVVDELPAEVFRILVREGRPMSFEAVPESGGDGDGGLLAQPGDEDRQGGDAAMHTDTRLRVVLRHRSCHVAHLTPTGAAVGGIHRPLVTSSHKDIGLSKPDQRTGRYPANIGHGPLQGGGRWFEPSIAHFEIGLR